MKARTYFEPFTYHIYFLFISSLFKVDFYLAYKLRNTVERTYQTLLQNLWLKSLFSNPEDYVTMRNFLLRTFNSDVSPFLTVTTKQFWGKNTCEAKPTLWNNLDTKIKFWQICRLLWLYNASHQLALMGSCLNISHTCLPCLPSRWVSPGILYPDVFSKYTIYTFSNKKLQSPGTYISGHTWDPSQGAITK